MGAGVPGERTALAGQARQGQQSEAPRHPAAPCLLPLKCAGEESVPFSPPHSHSPPFPSSLSPLLTAPLSPRPPLQLGLGETQMLDKILYEEEVRRCVETYEQQFHYGVFYAYMRLRCAGRG